MNNFFKRMLSGAAIGTAMIIPGVSGGTIAVLINVYDKLINAVSDLKNNFKSSILYLLPIILGAVAAVVAAYFPLKFALNCFPLATVLLFTGLMAGSLFKLVADARKNGFKKRDLLAVTIPFVAVIGLSLLPTALPITWSADLSASMGIGAYVLLFLVGIIASTALIIPGVSGSMMLMIMGYYQSILNAVADLTVNFWHSALVLAVFALGILVGFLTVSKIIKFIMERFKRAFLWAIVGFVVGSFPAIFIVFAWEYGYAAVSLTEIVCGAILFVCGFATTLILNLYVQKRANKRLVIK